MNILHTVLLVFSIIIIGILGTITFLYIQETDNELTEIQSGIVASNVFGIKTRRTEAIRNELVFLQEALCIKAQVAVNQTCVLGGEESVAECFDSLDILRSYHKPECTEYKKQGVEIPDKLAAVYMTSRAAGSSTFRSQVVSYLDSSELLNSAIIDIKEVDGSLPSQDFAHIRDDLLIKQYIKDLPEFLDLLKEKEIYRIARITVFKDLYMAKTHPEWAVKKLNQKDVWTDYGGKAWIDPAAREYWDYIIELSSESYQLGFDEINIDYIRFPSDGNMYDIWFPFSQEHINEDPKNARVEIINEFLTYYVAEMKKRHPDVIISGDVFGMVTTNTDDLFIGQNLESMAKVLDYIAPMVYPSHYPTGFIGLKGHPDNYPYEVVNYSIAKGVARLDALGPEYRKKMRPWLQDFTCTWCTGYFPYGQKEIELQIKAIQDTGVESFMLWNPNNRYLNASKIVQ